MSHRSKLLKGTLILTATGLATRVMGFFYRIFMSHAFGEEGVGIYQLVFPIYALGFSLTCAGIELILSRLVAKNMALGKKKEARELLYSGLLITVIFSCIVTLFLQNYAGTIASSILHDTRCTELLLILSYAFPFAAIHSCVCGYYFGQKETGLPARSQLIEQAVRFGSVMLIYFAGSRQGITFGVSLAVAGLIAGELASSLYCLKILSRQKEFLASRPSLLLICRQIPKLLIPSLPLTGNRVLLGILQSAEALSIPLKLQASGLSGQEALSVYGVLTGMALPCILFPSAISNSISTMLLPEVAEIQALNNKQAFRSLIQKTTCSCIAMGSLCCLFLLFTGRWIGTWIFHSSLAGELIQTLSWMCPFLYTNNTLISTINGIGKTTLTFLINSFSLLIRIASIFFLIPVFGIQGYLWGLLASQLSVFCLCLLSLCRYGVSSGRSQITLASAQTSASERD